MPSMASAAPSTQALRPKLSNGPIFLPPSGSDDDGWATPASWPVDRRQVFLGDRHAHGHQGIDDLADAEMADKARQHVALLPGQAVGVLQGRDHVVIGHT